MSSSSSSQASSAGIPRPQQPTPRMTDSTSGPNGPHSLAFASLSVQSYHLDSPPFTGTSIGSYGPLAQEGERLAAQERQQQQQQQQRQSIQNQQNPTQTTASTQNAKKASSPLSRAVKVDEMSRIVDQQQDGQDQVQEDHRSQQVGLESRNPSSNPDHHSLNHSQSNGNKEGAASNSNHTNQSSNDRDVPKWQLDGSSSSSPSNNNSLPSQSQSRSQLPTNLSSQATSHSSSTNSTTIPNSTSRSVPPFSSNGSGESSGISTPISNFKSSTSITSSTNDDDQSSSSSSHPLSSSTSNVQHKVYSGGAHSSMESNSHSHAGSTSPPIVDQHQPSHSPNHSSKANNARKPREREDSASRPSYTQLTSQDSSSEHEGDEADSDPSGTRSNPVDEEVDGDDTAFVIQNPGQSNGAAGPIGASAAISASIGSAVPSKGVPVQGSTKEEYKFPRHRLPTRMRDESKTPLVIVACGSFSPPTYLHLRIFEMAKDQIIESGKYELLGGYYSPVSDYYKKEGLAPARHRVRMCELAVEKTSTWLMVDAWESLQDEYQRTAVVLDHFDDEINGPRLAKTNSRPSTAVNGSNSAAPSSSNEGKERGGVLLSDGSRKRIKIMLLAGGDLIQSMGEPGIWASADLHHILGRYGCLIVERTGADVWSFLLSHDLLWKYRRNLKIVKQTIYNDISSSKVRLFVRRGQSIKYLLPNSVIHYIEKHKLYRLPPAEEHDEAALDDENW